MKREPKVIDLNLTKSQQKEKCTKIITLYYTTESQKCKRISHEICKNREKVGFCSFLVAEFTKF